MTEEADNSGARSQRRFLGVHLSKEVDVLALLAFLGSLVALGWQGWNSLRGPEVAFAPITQAVFYLKEVEDSSGAKGDVVYIAAATTLYNLGAPGYADFVSAQTATLTVGGCRVVFDAQNIVKLGRGGGRPEPPTYEDDWGGIALEHGTAVTRSIEHSALFTSREQELSCVLFERFAGEIEKVRVASVQFQAQMTSGRLALSNCELHDLAGFVQELKRHRVSAVACA